MYLRSSTVLLPYQKTQIAMNCSSFRRIQMSHRIVARSGVVLLLPVIRCAISVLLLACLITTGRAQTTRATVVGTLTDSSGARIAGGTVSIEDLATGIEHSATTD